MHVINKIIIKKKNDSVFYLQESSEKSEGINLLPII